MHALNRNNSFVNETNVSPPDTQTPRDPAGLAPSTKLAAVDKNIPSDTSMHALAPHAHRRLRGLSFRQSLLAAFLVITVLLGGAAVQALLALEHVARQSREAAHNAVRLTESAQRLAERTVAMERSARQFLVLDDDSLRERYQSAWQEARATQDVIAATMPVEQQTFREWAVQAEGAWDILNDAPRQTALPLLTPIFSRLHTANEALAQRSQQEVDRRNDALLADLEQQRQLISGLVMGALVVAALFAFGFGWWLSRPMRRIGKAINRLGDNQFDQPIVVSGPVDLQRLGGQLDWLRQRLAALESDKTRFVRHISHELKTPLASIREGVALLQDGVAGPLTPDQAEVARILRDSTVALQGQIEDLLRYHATAYEAQRLRCQPVDVKALLLRITEAQRLQWQAKNLSVSVSGQHRQAELDADKLSVALGNLLSNAVRFSPEGRPIRFVVSDSRKRLAIDCIDEGPGVAPEDAERIFDPFYQGRHQPAGARHGSGIGLSIVREYVRAHGGSVRLVPREGGAHFRIELPHEQAVA